MKRIVTSEEMKFCDSSTIEHFGVPSLVLMERAALSVVEQMPAELSRGGRILVVCGNGNNGADGLAIARLLYQRGCTVAAVQMKESGKRSPENQLQRQILERYGVQILDDIPGGDYAEKTDTEAGKEYRVSEKTDTEAGKERNASEKTDTEAGKEHNASEKTDYDCVIDALFGIGLSRAPAGAYAEWITAMNRLSGYKIAVDMPSGVSSDSGEVYEAAFQADLTVTFAYQKAGQVLYPGCEKCGAAAVTEIGITDESWLERRPSIYALEKEDLKRLPHRPARSNKGTFGRLLVIAGSKDMAGAALFCAAAAYRTGCGLVKVCTPEDNRLILQSALPEAVLMTYEEKKLKQEPLLEAMKWADVIALGPGIGTGRQARRIVELVLEHADVPLAADADALNIAAEHLELLKHTKAELIITPHLGEMARLCRKTVPEIQSSVLQTARDFAKRFHLVCVLKDAVTVTAVRDGAAYLNTSGCNAMAKGGSGDVLTGIIAGLLGQGMPAGEAAAMGVYIHGLAGEAAAEKHGNYSVLARDIIGMIGTVMKTADV